MWFAVGRYHPEAQGPPASPPSLHRSAVVARSVQLAPEGVRSPNGPLKDPRGTISFSGGHSFTAPFFEATTTCAQSSVLGLAGGTFARPVDQQRQQKC
ncbi:hypothetical protein AK812_SmicGene6818 [Symbiodinium microadriaticum]|uniref:Uncharacterized protein n=1 Tax=Symbiodinium microadriaticum TaxID=2951 RepID=A0A1Q9EQ88_SYMMI|nr:hypothetical protein AK812_SmicGene6818 [Symbiodinium microadriaticum]